MKKAKSRAQRRRAVRNVLLAVSMMMMLMIVTVGGTVAWLTATSQEVTNVFTTSDITIELKEHDLTLDENGKQVLGSEWTHTGNNDYKMIPGIELPKDPTVTVKAGSEAAWLFVKITEDGGDVTVGTGNNAKTYTFDNFLSYGIADGWTELTPGSGIYWREVADLSATGAQDASFKVLANDKVIVSENITKEMMNAVKTNNKQPTLNFIAYAIQKEGSDDAAAAWAKLNP